MPNLMRFVYGGPGLTPQTFHAERPDYDRGDALYFAPHSTARLQIRPLCISDMVAGFTYPPGCWLLVVLTKSGIRIRAVVPLPVALRKNTASNARRALKLQIERAPEFSEMIRICDQVPAAGS